MNTRASRPSKRKLFDHLKFTVRTAWLGLFFALTGCQGAFPFIPITSDKSTTVPAFPEAGNIIEPTTIPTDTPTQIPVIVISSPISTPPSSDPISPSYPLTGITIDRLLNPNVSLLVQEAPIAWSRIQLNWSAVEPVPGARNWEAVANLDQSLQIASDAGIRMILVLEFTPEWARLEGFNCGPVAPDRLSDFTFLVKDAVKRYSEPPYNIHEWELWNEPDAYNFLGCWGDPSDPYYGGGRYAEMLKAVYPVIKEADPQSEVLVGGLLLDCDPIHPPINDGGPKDCTSSRFLEGILLNGGGSYFDGISFHAYDYYWGSAGKYQNPNWNSTWNASGPVFLNKLSYLRQLLFQFNVTGKDFYNTEVALICGRTGEEPECQTDAFTRAKNDYLVEVYAYALAEGLKANLWYSLQGWRASGLVGPDYQPLESFQAYKMITQYLSGAVYNNNPLPFPGMKSFEFTKDRQTFWILWSVDGETHYFHSDLLPERIRSANGTDLSVTQDFAITDSPTWIFWPLP